MKTATGVLLALLWAAPPMAFSQGDTKSPDMQQQKHQENLPSNKQNAPGITTGQGTGSTQKNTSRRRRSRHNRQKTTANSTAPQA